MTARVDAAALAAARARVTVAARRAGWSAPFLGPGSRAAGRIARAMPQVADLDPFDPALLPVLDPALGERALAAAAAALAGPVLLHAIAPPDRAHADALVSAEARAFAAAHPRLGLPPGGQSLEAALQHGRALVSAEWRARLPALLAAECPDHRVAAAAPLAVTAAASPPSRGAAAHRGGALRALRPRRGVVLAPAAGAVPLADRPARALDLALSHFASLPAEPQDAAA